MRSESIRVLCSIHIVECDVKLLGVLHGLHNRIAAQVGELGDVLDVERADIYTCIASCAGPYCLLCNPLHDGLIGTLRGEQDWSVVVGVVANIVDDLHRIEAFT